MTRIKEVLDIALKTAILICMVVALCNTIGARKDISEVAGEISTYKLLISQPIGENEEIECEGESCDSIE